MVSTVPQINISEIWQKLQVKNLTLEWLQDVLSLPRLVKRNSLHLCRDRTKFTISKYYAWNQDQKNKLRKTGGVFESIKQRLPKAD